MIIDFHTHLLPPSFEKKRSTIAAKDRTFATLFAEGRATMASTEQLLLAMDEDDVDIAVGLGYGWTNADVARESNDYLMEAAEASNGRIIAFCSVNPAWGELALREIERCIAGGAKGIGELHPASQQLGLATDERLGAVMELAVAEHLPVVIHGSEPVGHTYAGKGNTYPSVLLALAERYPSTQIVGAHWGGGLPFYAHMPEVRKALANLWFDSATSPFLYDRGVYSTIIKIIGSNRVLFGSDFPLIRQKRVAVEAITELKPAQVIRFMGANAAELLRL